MGPDNKVWWGTHVQILKWRKGEKHCRKKLLKMALKKIPHRYIENKEHEACKEWNIQSRSMTKIWRRGPTNVKEHGWIMKLKMIGYRGIGIENKNNNHTNYSKNRCWWRTITRLQIEENTINHPNINEACRCWKLQTRSMANL